MMNSKVFEAQKALLTVHDAMNDDDWISQVIDALEPILGTERLYFLEPCRSIKDDGSPDERISVKSRSLGVTFERGISSHFCGYDSGGYSRFKDDYATYLHRAIRLAGTGAFNDTHLYCPSLRGAMEIQQEVFRPLRIERQLALSVPERRGESMLIAGYDHREAPDPNDTRNKALIYLLPAFEAAVGFRRALKQVEIEAIDACTQHQAFASISLDGEILFLNNCFREHLAAQQRRFDLMAAVKRFAAQLAALAVKDVDHSTLPVQSLTVDHVRYRLHGRLVESTDHLQPQVHVWLRCGAKSKVDPYLSSAFGLTSRELEVAALIVEGLRDKEIARHLCISPNTVRRHSEALLRKTGLTSRSGLGTLLFN
ncbi:helix-turn-helix transcriptional regulator [Cognatiyoonia sp. IB215446]|uniref:helix-turn-helix transcriptional regulator n=1 Tax=Cognatiyoonia sp. IB215446 TaxID=3097355 RepID=UPI002A150C91|nr:helix-turn-helix transcriptional regulator [Cognatiyoonia sp. IB215446]MDX8349363.1 helix-turn-helix transcriptional regulator [Cognatiyoonia sp. IB215446]